MDQKFYDLFFVSPEKKQILYCPANNDDVDDSTIIKRFSTKEYIGPLSFGMFRTCSDQELKNIERMFVLYDPGTNENEVYQVCSRVADITGTIIPGAYYVRKIGNLYN